jgi:hypothetical protein
MKKIVFQIMYGGLGDHLFYTPLPRLAKKAGYDKVFISTLSPFRHPDYKKIVWDLNPYVDGFIEEEGCKTFIDVVPITEQNPDFNLIDALVYAHGFDDGERIREPELYFKPEIRSDLQNAVVYDPNYVSNVGRIQTKGIENFFKKNRFIPDFQLKPRGETNFPIGFAKNELITPTLEEYMSVIVSCKEFYCLTSGGATLAAALGKPCFAFYSLGQGKIFHHSKLHQYIYIGSFETDLELLKNQTSMSIKQHFPSLHKGLKKILGRG